MEARNHTEETKATFEGGSTRSEMSERFDLIPFEGLEAVARRFGLGAVKHGDRNWEAGGEKFAAATLNHLLRHAALFAQTRQTEDLDAIACNALMLCRFRALGEI